MSGCWVFVCGPSGAGKDSVIGWARRRLDGDGGVVFAQRIETRPAPAAADHQALDAAQFDSLERSGGLAWHWQAHGLRYGIASRYARQVAWGRVVVVNGSREHVAGLPPDSAVHIVQIVASTDELQARLARRGREDAAAVAARLERNARLGPLDRGLVLSNDAALAVAGERLAGLLRAYCEISEETQAPA